MGILSGLSKKETLLSTMGELFDLVSVKTKGKKSSDDD